MMIRRFQHSFLIMAFFYAGLCPATSQEQFLEANSAYKNSDFEKALSLYQALENKGAAVWYNMGNCWYRLEKYSNALVCWKKALKYGGAHWYDRIDYNCKYAYKKLGITVVPSSFYRICSIVNRYSIFMWQFLFLLLFYLILGLAFHWYGKKYALFLILPLCLVSMSGVCLAVKHHMTLRIQAIVHHECPVVAGTDERFSKIGMLVMGQEVIVKEEKGHWCKIQSNDYKGWILMENIEYI